MTKSEHIEAHKRLHRLLDELIADFIFHSGKLLSRTTILDLMIWSHKQTSTPDGGEQEPQERSTNEPTHST